MPTDCLYPIPMFNFSISQDAEDPTFSNPYLRHTFKDLPYSGLEICTDNTIKVIKLKADFSTFIRDVKFSYSKRTDKITTVVFFADGTKTMATPMDGDEFSPEEGIDQCILKKLFGNRSHMKKQYKKWIEKAGV